jgi:hypothetical protein
MVEYAGRMSTTSTKLSTRDWILRGENRALELGGRNKPTAPAGSDPGHERIWQIWTAA